MKKIKLLVGLLLVVLVVVGVGLFMNKNALLKAAVEKSLSYVLEVDVTLGKAELSLSDGSVKLYDLKVANPDGYKTGEAFSFAQLNVTIDPGSLTGDGALVVKEFSTDKVNFTYEKKSLKMSNIKQLLDSASRFSSGEEKAEEEKPTSKEDDRAGKEVQIDLIRVAETGVTIAAPMLAKNMVFKLPTVTIKDVGSADNKVLTVAEAVTIFLKELLTQTLANAQGLPTEVLDAMRGNLKDITEQLDKAKEQLGKAAEELEDTAKKAVEGLKDAPGKILKDVKPGEALKGVGEGAKKAAEDLKKGLGGLLKK